ncbi:MAG: hypothetical protein ACTHOD_10770 [Motilibacteraceae bacterium]
MSGIAAELSGIDLFGDLAAPALERLACPSQERHLLRGEILFLQDDPASHL